MKRTIVAGLSSLCSALDALPSWEKDGGRLRRFRSGYGCRIGVARWSDALDQRWGTGVWKT